MASFGHETRTATVTIERRMKNGEWMEFDIEVEGTYSWDETGADVSDIEFPRLYGEEEGITRDSLTDSEWEMIVDAIAEA